MSTCKFRERTNPEKQLTCFLLCPQAEPETLPISTASALVQEHPPLSDSTFLGSAQTAEADEG